MLSWLGGPGAGTGAEQFGLPLLTLAQGLPDLAYLILASGAVALLWGIARTAWAYAVLHGARNSKRAAQIATI